MDVLIIKKASGVKIEKNIGHLFEDHHIFEFKSEKESLTQWDDIKVMGYANLYASFEKVALPDVTISLVSHRYPRNVLNDLKDKRGLKIKETMEGISYIEGDVVKVQVIESKKLSEQENLFLKSMRSDLTPLNLQASLEQSAQYEEDMGLVGGLGTYHRSEYQSL